jgi:hypothetical protein
MVAPSPAQWRRRAEEAERLAEAMHDPRAKLIMPELAVGYLALAEHAAAREQQNKPWLREQPNS